MNSHCIYRVMLFSNVTSAMRAEKFLKNNSVPHKLIPVPKSISSDCGICLRFEERHEKDILSTLDNLVDYSGIEDI